MDTAIDRLLRRAEIAAHTLTGSTDEHTRDKGQRLAEAVAEVRAGEAAPTDLRAAAQAAVERSYQAWLKMGANAQWVGAEIRKIRAALAQPQPVGDGAIPFQYRLIPEDEAVCLACIGDEHDCCSKGCGCERREHAVKYALVEVVAAVPAIAKEQP